jgi:phenylpyruvate tautomerase PptA (4-oxalocrotonate tautomerase family)
MPRVIAKLASGTSEQQRAKLMEEIAQAVVRPLKGHCDE